MQIHLPRGPAVPSPAETKRSARNLASAWIDALPLFAHPAAFAQEREQIERRDSAQRQLQRDQRTQALAVSAANAERPSDVLQRAERDVDPSSRAFARQDARRQIDQRYAQDRQSFREALQDARVPRPAPSTPGPDATRDSQPPAAVNEPEATPPPEESAPRTATSATARPAAPASSQSIATPAPATSSSQTTSSAAQTAPPVQATPEASAPTAQTPAPAMATSTPVESAAATSNTQGITEAPTARPAASTNTNATADAPRPPSRTFATTDKAPATDPSAEPADPSENFDKILRVLRQQIGRERSTTIMRIDPPHLGSLRMQMDLRKEEMSLRVETQTPLAHRLLSDEIDRLRAGLDAAGIQLQRVEIVPPPNLDGARQQAAQEQSGRRRESRSRGNAGTDARLPSSERDGPSMVARKSAAEPRVNLMA